MKEFRRTIEHVGVRQLDSHHVELSTYQVFGGVHSVSTSVTTLEIFGSIPEAKKSKTRKRLIKTAEAFIGTGAVFTIGALGGLDFLTEGLTEGDYKKVVAGLVACSIGVIFSGKIGLKYLRQINTTEMQLESLEAFARKRIFLESKK